MSKIKKKSNKIGRMIKQLIPQGTVDKQPVGPDRLAQGPKAR